ncbi:MAG: hypothetical protein AWU57_1622 [Marinobacter sp. T13-3]|nr:MAG: hypothetical protein AWU57_1622 [Marinobacter sp. T13-3]
MTDNSEELPHIDLTRPHKRIRVGDAWVRFKPRETEDGRVYVPSFISWQGEDRPGWRVRINRASRGPVRRYFSAKEGGVLAALERAWDFVADQLLADTLIPPTARPAVVSLNTGMTGVRLGLTKPDEWRSLMLRVGQSTESDRAHNEVFHSAGPDGMDRTTFLKNYRKALAARHYYNHLRNKHYRLAEPITRTTTIPPEFYPDTLPVPDLYEQALATWPELEELVPPEPNPRGRRA